MCLGIPGQVVEMTDPDAYLAKVDVNGIKRAISVRLLADSGIDIGDWVLVHVGFAMAKIDEREATATLDAVRLMGKAYTDELDAFRATEPASGPGKGQGPFGQMAFEFTRSIPGGT
jgi:hydrogenase expression/formation protein HypC